MTTPLPNTAKAIAKKTTNGKAPSMRERQIEKAVCDHAKSKGVLCYKFVSPGTIGVPDRLFLYQGRAWFVEFKTVDGKMTPAQTAQRERIRSHEIDVFIVDNVEQGKAIIDGITQ